MNRRRLLAAALWALLAFLVWNVRFDLGVRQSATRYLVARGAYLQGKGARIEMAPAMREGIAASAQAASLVAAPALLVTVVISAGLRGANPRRRPEKL
jgi:hypothetical protein